MSYRVAGGETVTWTALAPLTGVSMGEGLPGGTPTAWMLDAGDAHAALLRAGTMRGLDAMLQEAAGILRARFGAEFACAMVDQPERHTGFASSPAFTATHDHDRVVDLLVTDPAGLSALDSVLRAPLMDTDGELTGLCAVVRSHPAGFTDSETRELTSLTALLGLCVRTALTLEAQAAQQDLLAREARLLTAVAEAETEARLAQTVADTVRECLGADLSLVMVEAPEAPSRMVSSPATALTSHQWDSARAALAASGNNQLSERSRQTGAFSVPDLDLAETPLETWMRDECGMNSLAAATRSHHWGGLGLGIAALRRERGPWTEAQRGFLLRLTRVLEISVERLRRGEIAVDHALRLEQHAESVGFGAELVELISTSERLGEACDAISQRMREYFDGEYVAFGLFNPEQGTRQLLGFCCDLLERSLFNGDLTPADVEAYRRSALSEGDWFADLAALPERNEASERMLRGGIRSIMRAPFKLLDGSIGLVTVGSTRPGRYAAVDTARLNELCRPLGIAIDRVRILARMQRTSEVLATKTRVLAELTPAATVESAGNTFVAEVQRVFNAEYAVAALVREGRVRVVGCASQQVSIEELREAVEGPETSANWRTVLEGGQPQLVDDLGEHPTLSPGEAKLAGRGLRCLMRVPIRDSRGRVRGIVTAATPVALDWDEHDLSALEELSQALGLVVERTEMYAATHEHSAKAQALTRLLSTLNLNLAPAEVARLFSAQVRAYLGVDAVFVYAFERESQMRVRVAYDADAGASLSPERVSLGESSGYRGMMDTPMALYDGTRPDSAPDWLAAAAAALGFGGAACVRLDVAGEPVGMIAAGAASRERIGEPELSLLAAIAPPLGMILERSRAVTSLRLQTQRTQAVLDILAALGPAETIEEVAGPVASALRLMYGADHCAIGSVERDGMVLVGVDSSITTWACGHRATLEDLWGPAHPTGPVIHVVGDLAAETELPAITAESQRRGMRSSMRVLIGTPADPLGVVTVGSRTPGRFTDFDARQLAQIVQPLAVTARYFRGKRETELRTSRLETTNRILTRLSAGGAPEHLARGFLAECRSLFGCVHALAVEFEHADGTGRVIAVDSSVDSAELPMQFTLDEMHSARLLRQPTPQLLRDAREERELNARHRHLIEHGVYSAIRAPLVVHDTVRGAVSLWGEGPNRFSSEDAELLGTLTRPLALALEKASALESLGESELKYRSLVAQADEMIFLFDPTSLRLLDANSFTSRALGYEPQDLNRLRLDQMLDAPRDEISRQVAEAVAVGELHLPDVRFLRSDGSVIEVEAVASMVTFGGRQAALVLARDVSERKALIRQLVQSQKMDSLGAMAGAVAHDFNNLLTTILGFAGLLKRSPNMDAEERENLGLIEEAARKAADLTGRLLSFSRGGLARFGPVNLCTVVEDTLQLAEPTMHSGLKVTRELPPNPVLVEGDAGQLQQALTNIVLNARDAMPEGGSIAVTLAMEGAVAVVRIADTGPGMDDETRVRIFEPFYTTKPAGSGTGLGMAITYGIIQGHHGDISVESAVGRGTTFTLSLPLLEQTAEAEPADVFNAGEGNLVLVVDDDAMVRRTTTATLAELGYNVVEAPGGSTAVEILRARPDRFSAVLLDLVMPGMTGSETFRALTAIRADLPVIVCTGYAADSHIDTDVKRRIAGLVQKPFTAERLGRALLAAGAQPTRASRI